MFCSGIGAARFVSCIVWCGELYDPCYDRNFLQSGCCPENTGREGGSMTLQQQILTIAVVALGTMLTRFLPFLLFPAGKETPRFVQYLGKYLPPAVFGLLVIYCLKNVTFLSSPYGIPEAIAIVVVVGLHLWKRQLLLSIAGGTVCHMLLVQFVF